MLFLSYFALPLTLALNLISSPNPLPFLSLPPLPSSVLPAPAAAGSNSPTLLPLPPASLPGPAAASSPPLLPPPLAPLPPLASSPRRAGEGDPRAASRRGARPRPEAVRELNRELESAGRRGGTLVRRPRRTATRRPAGTGHVAAA